MKPFLLLLLPCQQRLKSFSVGVKGRPRSPLNSFFNRRSLELLLRRMMPGATAIAHFATIAPTFQPVFPTD